MGHRFVRRSVISRSATFSALFVLGCGPAEDQASTPSESQVGTSFPLSGVSQAFDEIRQFRVGAFGKGTLRLPAGRAIELTLENLSSEGEYLAMNGHAANSPESRFILKGSRADLRGWLVLRDQNVAFEYKTVNGTFMAEEVPVERIYPVCNLSRPPNTMESAEVEPFLEAPSGLESFIGTYNGGDLRKLESRPGAKKVLYLDITQAMNGDTPKDFSKEEMWKSWAGVAAGYSSFDVNVTTDASVYAAAGVANSGFAKLISTDDRASCPMDVFGTRVGCQIFTGSGAEPEKGYGVARSTLHELGHLLDLAHDGTSSEEYFSGLPAFDWAPIMGDYYRHSGNEALNQWRKGEYSGSNNKEDDLAIITKNLPYREDDVPDAKPLQINGTDVTSNVNRGQIARSSDSDKFTFKNWPIRRPSHAERGTNRIHRWVYVGRRCALARRLGKRARHEQPQSSARRKNRFGSADG